MGSPVGCCVGVIVGLREGCLLGCPGKDMRGIGGGDIIKCKKLY